MIDLSYVVGIVSEVNIGILLIRTMRRVVCTGLGTVTPLGCTIEAFWKNLLKPACGIEVIKTEGLTEFPSKIASFVPRGKQQAHFDESSVMKKGDSSTMTLPILFALHAAQQALVDADWLLPADEEKISTGVAVGCGIAGLEDISATSELLRTKGYKRVSPYFVPRILSNMSAGHISIRYGFKGPVHSVSTACATGAHAIGDSMRLIRNGDADVMVCGGTEACINELSLAGFSRARALSTGFNNNPSEASRPFDKDRDGFVIGEGAGIIVLEELEHAKKRNAKMYAEVLGYGMSGDAYHITAPSLDGNGAKRAMKACLRDAALNPNDINYINAHATSTPIGDAIENRAIKSLFGEHSKGIQISSIKGHVGHLLGAAGAVESISTILTVYKGICPPTLNLNCVSNEEEFNLNYVPNLPQELYSNKLSNRKFALCNSFGFGGTNASVCFSSIDYNNI